MRDVVCRQKVPELILLHSYGGLLVILTLLSHTPCVILLGAVAAMLKALGIWPRMPDRCPSDTTRTAARPRDSCCVAGQR